MVNCGLFLDQIDDELLAQMLTELEQLPEEEVQKILVGGEQAIEEVILNG